MYFTFFIHSSAESCRKPRLRYRIFDEVIGWRAWRTMVNLTDEMDIIPHLALCARWDLTQVGHIEAKNFRIASQAWRKWSTKIIDTCDLGAVSASVLVASCNINLLYLEIIECYYRAKSRGGPG